MKNTSKFMMASALTGFMLCGTLLANVASAQDPPATQQGGQPGAPGGGRGQGRNGGQGRGPGGFGGGNMTMGTITGGDLNSGLITVASQFGGGVTNIRVNPNTQIMSQVTISVADLKVGDQVQVQGIPASITANTISAGETPAFLQGGGRNRGAQPGAAAGAPGANPNGQPPNGQPNANTPPQPQAFATATGKVVSKSPLTISLGNDISVTLKLAQNTKITKLMPVTIASLKVGDTVMAAGQTEADGSFTATGIGVNLANGRGGPGGFGGGFGGRGGGAGFGGPGGAGANGQPGGFGGGRRGNRGNRGAGGAGGAGNDAPPPGN